MSTEDFEKSLSDEATLAGAAKRRPTAEMSLGDERTLGDRLGDQDTVINDIEVVDLEARYRVEGTLGRGGMGEVRLALDTRLGRKVAIKRILGEAARSTTAINRFITEAKAVAALNHPNIVQIYDYGRAKDGPFLIMEYVDGSSLLDRCRESALPLEEAIALACQLCDGLGKAHDLGIVHRDIKPANVLLTKDAVPKLTDFGLAKAEASDHQMTMTGAVLGTPDFMPPEQRRDASEVDARSDLWSLAATVYQMVTGRSPKIIRFDLLPPHITKVLGKALEDSKNDRYQTAREFRDALKSAARKGASAHSATMPGEGECPACGVQNDPSRRFCRSCGTTLEAPCLSCDKPMPMWEEICGSCGAKQTPLVDVKQAEALSSQAQAEGLLGDLEFDAAVRIAKSLRDEPHPRLSFSRPWAETFLKDVEKSQAEQTQRSQTLLVEALIHETAHDYPSAMTALEGVPPVLRSILLPGQQEPVAAVLSRVRAKREESERLDNCVRAKVSSQSFDDLLPDIEQLLVLRPDRQDVQRVRQQLLERRQKQESARDEAMTKASALVEQHAYEEAVALLDRVPSVVGTRAIRELRGRAAALAEQAGDLMKAIRIALGAKRFDSLLTTVDEYLRIKPADAAILKLRQSLVERQHMITTKRRELVEHAKRLISDHNYDEAHQLLEKAPPGFRSPESTALWKNVGDARSRLKELSRLIRSKVAAGSDDGLLGYVENFLRIQPMDPEVGALREMLVAREEERANELSLFGTSVRAALSNGHWEEVLLAIQKRNWRDHETSIRDQLRVEALARRDQEFQQLLAVQWRRNDFRSYRFAVAVFACFGTVGLYGLNLLGLRLQPNSAGILMVGNFLGPLAWSTFLLIVFSLAPWFLQCIGVAVAGGVIALTYGGDLSAWVAFVLGFLGPLAVGIDREVPLIGTGIDARVAALKKQHGLIDPREQNDVPQSPATSRTSVFSGDFVQCPRCRAKVKQKNLQRHLDVKCRG